MATVKLFCEYCSVAFYKESKEINRKLKKNPNSKFYCSNICSGYGQPKKETYAQKICPVCKQKFECKTSNKNTNRTFCSRECASKGSVTTLRKETAKSIGSLNLKNGDILATAASLRSREMWKYKNIKENLDTIKINYQFEYIIERYIFDLALIDKKILIEFDGPYHQWLDSDIEKENIASNYGWKIIRIATEANAEISFSKIENII